MYLAALHVGHVHTSQCSWERLSRGKNMLCVSLVKQETTGHPESVRPAGAVNTLYLSYGRTQESQSSSLRNEGKWHFRCTAGSLCQWVLHPANVGAKILNKLYLY